MKRRNFIKQGLLGSLAWSLLPSHILWASADQRLMVFEMPAAMTHIRHGLFDYQPSILLKQSCDWMGQFQKDVFLKYGLNEEDTGLVHLSLTVEERLLNVALEEETIFVSKKDDTWEATLEEGVATLSDIFDAYSLKILRLSSDLSTTYLLEGEEAFITPLMGEFLFEGKTVNSDNGLYVKAQKKLLLKGKATILCIEK